jgi:hypothetical protein
MLRLSKRCPCVIETEGLAPCSQDPARLFTQSDTLIIETKLLLPVGEDALTLLEVYQSQNRAIARDKSQTSMLV